MVAAFEQKLGRWKKEMIWVKYPQPVAVNPRVSHPALSQIHYGKQCVVVNLWRVEKSSWEDKEYFRAVALAVSKTG